MTKRGILILDKFPTNGLDDATLSAEKENSINFIQQQNKILPNFTLHGVNSYIFVNSTEMYRFKAKG